MSEPLSPLPSQEKTEIENAERTALKTQTSKGERLFNLLTYGGVGGVLNFLVTIPIAYWAKYKGGAEAFKGASEFLTKTGMSAGAAKDVMMTTATMQGGNAVLVPVIALEHFKPEIVEKLNTMVGDKSGDASVDKEPEQDWKSLLKSRITAWLTVFASFRVATMALGGEKFEQFEENFSKHVVCEPLGKPTHTPGLAQTVENETKVFRLGKIAALDVFATTASATLLYVASRLFANGNPRWHAHDLPATEKATPTEQPAEQTATSRDSSSPEAAPLSPFTQRFSSPRPERFVDAVQVPNNPSTTPLQAL